MELTEEQINRYSRQIILKEIGGIGQEKLLSSTITIVGAGGLGSPALYYLGAAGVGKIRIIDFDKVETSNLHRQIVHFTKDVNKLKTESAREKLNQLNPDSDIEIISERLTPTNVKEMIEGSDFVIEGSDNLPTKMLINDACINLQIPFTISGVLRYHGQIMTINPKEQTACYRCVFGEVKGDRPGMSCSEAGVIGLTPGILGSMEAMEALKYILDIGELITNKILFMDLLNTKFNFIKVHRDLGCIACGENAKDLTRILEYGSEMVCQ